MKRDTSTIDEKWSEVEADLGIPDTKTVIFLEAMFYLGFNAGMLEGTELTQDRYSKDVERVAAAIQRMMNYRDCVNAHRKRLHEFSECNKAKRDANKSSEFASLILGATRSEGQLE